jgi:hypothetical protein
VISTHEKEWLGWLRPIDLTGEKNQCIDGFQSSFARFLCLDASLWNLNLLRSPWKPRRNLQIASFCMSTAREQRWHGVKPRREWACAGTLSRLFFFDGEYI